jgi:trehalose 6-phosphate phosphatase
VDRLLDPFVRDPGGSAVLLDIDGTLAPIVARPELAAVPAATLGSVGRLAERFGLVACVTGRSLADGRSLVPLDGVVIVGNHGLEWQDGDRIGMPPGVAARRDALRALLPAIGGCADVVGARLEDKGVIAALHFRGLDDPDGARERAERILAPTVAGSGLALRHGRLVLEVAPDVGVDKGTAVRALREAHGVRRALYAGDDLTDRDGFREADVSVAVASEETPPEVLAAADLVVQGPAELAALLERLI